MPFVVVWNQCLFSFPLQALQLGPRTSRKHSGYLPSSLCSCMGTQQPHWRKHALMLMSFIGCPRRYFVVFVHHPTKNKAGDTSCIVSPFFAFGHNAFLFFFVFGLPSLFSGGVCVKFPDESEIALTNEKVIEGSRLFSRHFPSLLQFYTIPPLLSFPREKKRVGNLTRYSLSSKCTILISVVLESIQPKVLH